MMSFVMPKTLKVDCDSQGKTDKWLSLEPHSIALLKWTIKQRSGFVNTPGLC